MAKYIIQDSTMSAIADAIREQTGESDPLTPAQMVDEIQSNFGDFSGLIGRTLTDIKHYSVDVVAPYAFYRYSTLKTAEFPNCSTVGASAFQNCTSLTYVSISQCKTVNTSAFAGCTNLSEVYLPECTTAPATAFTGCTKIQNATLGFTALTSTNFPFSIAKSNITDINLPQCSNIAFATFKSYIKLSNISAPVCTIVASQAFSSCTSLTSVYLPECTYVNMAAFTGCTKVSNVTLGFSELTSTNFPFSLVNSTLTEIHFPKCISLASSTFHYNDTSLGEVYLYYNLVVVDFPACTRIDAATFSSQSYLTYVNLPACEHIMRNAFANDTNLLSINVQSCKSIAYGAFMNCKNLAAINLPVCSVLGSIAFSACTKLTNVTLGNSSVVNLSNSNVFAFTPITNSSYTGSFGSIYVPASLVSVYKAAPNWSDIADRITAIVE